FVIGLLLSPFVYQVFTPLPEIQIAAGLPVLIVAGLLVGFGTRLGSGCTSGHGVCGLSRLSLRSLVATLTFMLVAMVVVWLSRH
ncbi:YeeE/YedE family protein, partial [Methylophilus sp.]